MKKTILSILGAVFCILVSVEPQGVRSQFILGAVAVTVFLCAVVLWKIWNMSADKSIRKFLEE